MRERKSKLLYKDIICYYKVLCVNFRLERFFVIKKEFNVISFLCSVVGIFYLSVCKVIGVDSIRFL